MVKRGAKWFRCADAKVTEIARPIVSESNYILFYFRNDLSAEFN